MLRHQVVNIVIKTIPHQYSSLKNVQSSIIVSAIFEVVALCERLEVFRLKITFALQQVMRVLISEGGRRRRAGERAQIEACTYKEGGRERERVYGPWVIIAAFLLAFNSRLIVLINGTSPAIRIFVFPSPSLSLPLANVQLSLSLSCAQYSPSIP